MDVNAATQHSIDEFFERSKNQKGSSIEGTMTVSESGEGMEGVSASGEGMEGVSASGEGMEGVSASGEGMEGVNESGEGMEGVSGGGEGQEGVSGGGEEQEGVSGGGKEQEGVSGGGEEQEGVSGGGKEQEGVSGGGEGQEGVNGGGEGQEGVSGGGDTGEGMVEDNEGGGTAEDEGTVAHGPVVVSGHHNVEFRDIDFADVEKVDEFCKTGCGCSMNCERNFSMKHFLLTRGNAQQMHRKELDMAIMGQIMAFTFCSEVPQNSTKHRHQLKKRERNTSLFFHNGIQVCKQTFLFLHDIGDYRLRAIRAHYIVHGLVPRTHGHTGRTAPNALVLEDVKGIITFVMQYVESNGVLLPGRVPGYKRDDVKLLPSNCTKRAVWMLYQDSTSSLSLRSVAYTTFCKVWRHFLADVVVCKPMTDLCAICQNNSAAIIRSCNTSEEEKSEVCACICIHACMYFYHMYMWLTHIHVVRASPRKWMVVPPEAANFLLWASCVVLPCLVFLSISWMIKVMYQVTHSYCK